MATDNKTAVAKPSGGAITMFESLPTVKFQTLDSQRGNFLSWPMERSGIWADVKATYPDFRPFEACVKLADDSIIRVADGLNVCQVMFLAGQQFYTDQNDKGEILRTRLTDPNDEKFVEHWETVLIVIHRDSEGNIGLYPVKTSFRRAMVNAVRKMVSVHKMWENPDDATAWAKKSPAHAAACNPKLPIWGRVYHKLRVTVQKGKRYDYPESSCVTEPVTPDLVKALGMYYADPESEKEVQNVLRSFNARVKDIESALTK